MHIGFFTDGYAPLLNGVATSLELLTTELESRGHAVSIFAPNMDGYVDCRPRVFRIPSLKLAQDPPFWLTSPILPKVLRQRSRLALDIAHVHTPFLLQSLAYQTARRAHIPLVTTYHTLLPAWVDTVRAAKGFPVSPRMAQLYSAWTCNLCEHIIAPSGKVKTLLREYGVRRPITVLPNGIVLERFQNRPRGFLRSRFGLRADAKIILCVGRLSPEKNVPLTIEMMARVAAGEPQAYLVLVGQGPLRESLQAQAVELGIRERVLFAGPVPHWEMPNVYVDADLYVSASFSEVHSMAALEALGAGLPLVVVNDRAFEEIIAEGKNGFRVVPQAEVFAARVQETLSQPALRERMGAQSRLLAQYFTVRAQTDRLVRLYNDLIANKAMAQRKLRRMSWLTPDMTPNGLVSLARPN